MIDLEFIRSREFMRAIWMQLAKKYSDGTVLARLLTIADLKSTKVIGIDREIGLDRSFLRRVYKAMDKVVRSGGIPEFYGSTILYDVSRIGSGIINYTRHGLNEPSPDYPQVSHSLVIDIDVKEGVNEWVMREKGLETLSVLDDITASTIGARLTFTFARGIQARVDLYPIHIQWYRTVGNWPETVVNTLIEVHKAIVAGIVRKFESRTGYRLFYDTKVYDKGRVVRLDFSPHAQAGVYSIPLSSDDLRVLTLDDVRDVQGDTDSIRKLLIGYSGRWGEVVDARKYISVVQAVMGSNIQLPQSAPVKRRRMKNTQSGWGVIIDPVLGPIEYDKSISGFNYAFVIVRNRLPIPDGRLNATWAMCPALIGSPKTKQGPIGEAVSEEDCLEWIKASIAKFPSGKDINEYEKQLKASLKHKDRYNIPLFEHLVTEKTADGKPLDDKWRELKYPILYALYEGGYIRLTQEQVERLKSIVGL